jgi:hypothetical protein
MTPTVCEKLKEGNGGSYSFSGSLWLWTWRLAKEESIRNNLKTNGFFGMHTNREASASQRVAARFCSQAVPAGEGREANTRHQPRLLDRRSPRSRLTCGTRHASDSPAAQSTTIPADAETSLDARVMCAASKSTSRFLPLAVDAALCACLTFEAACV